ncbi:MAG: hypothetical protein JJE41_16235 [Candidatus Heimdallarchaeota archaeon]|nr:hypothetical protein [Candidatus Heimdallarchaeota archaeon]
MKLFYKKTLIVIFTLLLITSYFSIYINGFNYKLDKKLKSKLQINHQDQVIKRDFFEINNFNTEKSSYRYQIQKLAQVDTGHGAMNDVFVQGELAFSTNAGGGLIIFNITDFTNPVIIGQYDDDHEISEENLWLTESAYTDGISVRGEVAYLADGFNGLVILNVSIPTQPVKIGHYLNEYINVQNIFVQEDFLYYRGTDKVYILNINNPSQPFLAGVIDYSYIPTMDIRDFYVQGDYAFLCAHDFIIIDISDSTNPIEIARLENATGVKLTIADDFAYLLSNERLEIINISNVYSPYSISLLSLPEITYFIQSICISNTTVYVAGYSEIISIDVTNKSAPVKNGLLANLGYSWKKLSVQSNTLDEQQNPEIVFCADYNQGFLTINFSNPADPVLLSVTDMGTKAAAVFVDEQYVYLCTRHASPWRPTIFEIISWTETSVPKLIGSYQVNKSISDVYVKEDIAYLSTYGDGLEILNLSNPSEPKKIMSYDYGSDWGYKLYFDDTRDLVVLANLGAGYAIIDVSTPTNPILLSEGNPWFMHVSNVFIDGDILFLTDSQYYGGFGIIDISNPSSPQPISSTGLSESVFSITIKDRLAYLSTDVTPLYIYDVSNLSKPQKLGRCYTGWWFPGHSLCVNNSVAYVARDVNGLLAIDVSNPRKPKLLATYRDNYAGLSFDVDVYNNYIFLADGWDGLEILELVPPVISRQQLLLFSILPSMSGGVLVAVIVILQLIKKKEEEDPK